MNHGAWPKHFGWRRGLPIISLRSFDTQIPISGFTMAASAPKRQRLMQKTKAQGTHATMPSLEKEATADDKQMSQCRFSNRAWGVSSTKKMMMERRMLMTIFRFLLRPVSVFCREEGSSPSARLGFPLVLHTCRILVCIALLCCGIA